MEPRGSIVVDEIVIPIVDIYLDGGRVCFVGRAHGSFPAVRQRDYTVYDRTGGVVFRGIGIDGLSWDTVSNSTLEVTTPVAFIGKIASGDS